MMNAAVLVYAVFASLLFVGLAYIDTSNYLGRRRRRQRRALHKVNYNPRVLVIIPCKGVDRTLYENLLSVKRQSYINYSIICVVDSNNDASLPVIRKAGLRYMVSSAGCKACSGKVRAVLTALELLKGYDVYVIADSDITVPASWLYHIVYPLHDRHTGLSSMFPRFEPRGGFWSRVKLVWGFVGDGLMQHESTRFGWGGSLAFRRDLLDRASVKFLGDSKYSVSDDICLTKIAKGKGLGIAYVAESRPYVNSYDNFAGFVEWANRQTALSILGYGKTLYMGLAFYSAEAITLLSGIILAYYASPFFILLLAHYLKNAFFVHRASGLGIASAALISLIMPFIYMANLVYASRMHEITWRGTTYKI